MAQPRPTLPNVFTPPTAARPPAPESPSGWYRVFTPEASFTGHRYGASFEQGEAVVGAHQKIPYPLPGYADQERRVIDLLVQDLGYKAVPIPEGAPPVPSRMAPPEPAA